MKKVELMDFLNFKFLSGLTASPDGTRAAFVVHTADYDNNKYLSCLHMLQGSDAPSKLIEADDVKSFIWLDHDTILYPSAKDEDIKKRKEAKEPLTCFYRLNVSTLESEKAFELPIDVNYITPLEDGKFLLLALFDRRIGNTWDISKEEMEQKIALLKEESDYEILDEIPFWLNGEGFTNKRRNRCFVFDSTKGIITPITDEFTNVQSVHLHPDKDKALLVTDSFIDKMGLGNNITELDLNTLKLEKISPIEDFSYDFAGYLKDMIIFIGRGMKDHGINENPKVFLSEDRGLSFVRLNDLRQDIGSSVGSDSRFGSGRAIKIEGEHLYLVSTYGYSSQLYRIGLDGILETLTTGKGSVDDFDVSGDKIFFTGMRNLELQEIYTVSCRVEEKLTNLNTDVLSNKELSVPEEIVIHNGTTELTGWVMRPYNYDKSKVYPAILNIHGGPKTVFGTVYFHEMQYWAGQGYIVFYMNPRGSDGYGDNFSDIRGKYGTVDYEDLMLFTDIVFEKHPEIDRFNVGVTGGSYGGYMTNWIIGHTNKFKAAASQRSISNWISFFGTSDIGYYFAADQAGATPWSNHKKLWDNSPLKYADKVQTPTLFIHSDEDYRCWLPEGLQMYTALKYHGVISRLVMFKGENHELSRSGKPKHRVRRINEITNWFDKYLTK
ncbi:MAG: S9 family peptidase [Gudongella sp.]|nr:S9 family peptidase [Gudongella sp.]